MSEEQSPANDMPTKAPEPPRPDRRHRWDTVGVIIASLVGLLALIVSGYTAYIQRQQVRAQVWPRLFVAYQGPERQLSVFNKGVGPAIVRGVQVTVDGTPQPDWEHVFASLGLPGNGYQSSTLAGAVLSPGDALPVLAFPEKSAYTRFRQAMDAHVLMDICYCSTLGECWKFEDHHPPAKPVVQPQAKCPRLPSAQASFRD